MVDYKARLIPTYQTDIDALTDIANLIHETAMYLSKVIHIQFAVIFGLIILVSWVLRGRK